MRALLATAVPLLLLVLLFSSPAAAAPVTMSTTVGAYGRGAIRLDTDSTQCKIASSVAYAANGDVYMGCWNKVVIRKADGTMSAIAACLDQGYWGTPAAILFDDVTSVRKHTHKHTSVHTRGRTGRNRSNAEKQPALRSVGSSSF